MEYAWNPLSFTVPCALTCGRLWTVVSRINARTPAPQQANIQGAVDENPEEEATGQRAEGLLRKGGTYVALLCNPIDPAEVVTSFKGRPGAQQHGRASITLTW